jgi:hypothetical protein
LVVALTTPEKVVPSGVDRAAMDEPDGPLIVPEMKNPAGSVSSCVWSIVPINTGDDLRQQRLSGVVRETAAHLRLASASGAHQTRISDFGSDTITTDTFVIPDFHGVPRLRSPPRRW